MSIKTKGLSFDNLKIHITGRHVHVTEAMKDYVIDKIKKLERITHAVIDINITMDIQKLEHKVIIIMRFDHTKVKIQASSEDMYASIDKVVAKLQNKITRYKSKLQDHHTKGLSVVDMKVHVLKRPDAVTKMNEQIEEENYKEASKAFKPHDVVKQETRPLKILTLDESIMKMELSGDTFMIYRSEEDRKIKIIYRRSDDNFGLIEPE